MRPSPATVLDLVGETGLAWVRGQATPGRAPGGHESPPHPKLSRCFTCLQVRQSPQEKQSSNESSRLRSARVPHTGPAIPLWLFGWGQLSPERRNVPRNVLPRLLPSGMSMATCPAWARWDTLAEPGWAAASPRPRRTRVASEASAASVPQHACDFCSHAHFWVGPRWGQRPCLSCSHLELLMGMLALCPIWVQLGTVKC